MAVAPESCVAVAEPTRRWPAGVPSPLTKVRAGVKRSVVRLAHVAGSTKARPPCEGLGNAGTVPVKVAVQVPNTEETRPPVKGAKVVRPETVAEPSRSTATSPPAVGRKRHAIPKAARTNPAVAEGTAR